MAEKLRYCIEYINPRFPLLDNGNLNIRHLRVEKEHFAEICITLILSFGGKIISTYKGAVTKDRVADWNPTLELKDKFSNKWLSEVLHEYPYVPGWRRNGEDNKPEVKHSVLMLTTHGIAEGEWLGDGKWCQYRWSCEVKDSEVLYWMHLCDLERLEKEDEDESLKKKEAQEEILRHKTNPWLGGLSSCSGDKDTNNKPKIQGLDEAAEEFANQDAVVYATRKKSFKAGAKWGEKDTIERAVKWWERNLRYLIATANVRDTYLTDFKRDMEEGL